MGVVVVVPVVAVQSGDGNPFEFVVLDHAAFARLDAARQHANVVSPCLLRRGDHPHVRLDSTGVLRVVSVGDVKDLHWRRRQ